MLAIAVEEVFYQELVEDLLSMVREAHAAGSPRPLILHELSSMLMRNIPSPAQAASLSALLLVLLEEEKRR